MYVCDYEERLYAKLDESERERLPKEILEVLKRIEEE